MTLKEKSDMIHNMNEKRYQIGSLEKFPKQLRDTFSEMIKNCRMSHYQIAAGMSDLLGYEVSATMLYNYTAKSHKQIKLPAEIIVAATIVCWDMSTIEALCSEVKGSFIVGDIKRIDKAIGSIGELLTYIRNIMMRGY